jgi:hypothetical protein
MPLVKRVGDGQREVQAFPGVWVVVDKGETVEVSEHAAFGAPASAGFQSIGGVPLGSATGGLVDQTDQWVLVTKRPKKTEPEGDDL